MGLRRQHTPRYKLMLKRLRLVRRENGLTQAEVARALGTTQAYVSKSESGERRMDAVELYDFAQIYGAPLETLLPASKVRPLAGAQARPTGVAEREARPKVSGQVEAEPDDRSEASQPSKRQRRPKPK
jgi:transcriptional regulator with XRE-family HTH domain